MLLVYLTTGGSHTYVAIPSCILMPYWNVIISLGLTDIRKTVAKYRFIDSHCYLNTPVMLHEYPFNVTLDSPVGYCNPPHKSLFKSMRQTAVVETTAFISIDLATARTTRFPLFFLRWRKRRRGKNCFNFIIIINYIIIGLCTQV